MRRVYTDAEIWHELEAMVQEGLVKKEWSEERGEYVYSNTKKGKAWVAEMKERTYTPGPWHIAPLDGKYYGTVVTLPDPVNGDHHVSVWTTNYFPFVPSKREVDFQPGDSYDHIEDKQSLANAQLIAAAPDLFQALQSLIEIGKRDMSNLKYDSYFESAKEALRKARGK